MTKKEIYILLRHELRQELDAQSERLAALERDVRAAIPAPRAEDTPHEAEAENASLVRMFRKAPELKRWLLASGIDSFPRLMAFLADLTPERVEAVKAVAKEEGYGC